MNARRTSLLIVLALALAACVAPIQAPPIRPQQPSTEQTIPFLQETEKQQFPVVTAPEMTIPQVPAVKPKVELPGMEDLAQEFPWVVQPPLKEAEKHSVDAMAAMVPPEVRADIERYTQPTELRRVPTLEEATLGVPIQIVPEIKRSIDAMRLVNELNAPTLPAEIQRDQWWIEETSPAPLETLPVSPEYERDRWWLEEAAPAAPDQGLRLNDVTLGVPMQIQQDIAASFELLKAPEIEQLTRGVPMQIHEDIARHVVNQ